MQQRGWQGGSVSDLNDKLPPVTRGFTWDFRRREQLLRIRIPMWLYIHYLARPRSPDYGVYVMDPFDDRIIREIASTMKAYARRNGLSTDEQLEFATYFVHQLEYVPDDVSTSFDDYPRYPVETLVHRGGDCEDASILLAAILEAMGEKVGFIRFPEHLQVGIVRDGSYPGAYYEHGGQRYYTLEATGGGWQLGELPPEYVGKNAEILPLSKVPVLLHRWSAATTNDSEISGAVHVTNLGSAPADSAIGLVQFESVSGMSVGNQTFSLDGIGADETRTFEFKFHLSDSEPIAARVRLFVDGQIHDESTSSEAITESERI